MPQPVRRPKGYALTVFRGPQLDSFGIEVIAQYRGGGVAGQDIMIARATGPLVEAFGGVPLGASGSPVYLDGRVVGAISGTYPPDHFLVTITPIRAMLALSQEPEVPGSPTGALGGATPPVVIGLTATKALAQLEQVLGRRVVPAPSAQSPCTSAVPGSLAAGHPVGLAVMTGDIRVGYIGTVTALRGSQVFAFGHPVTFSGPSNLPLTSAVIFDTARGTSPFKVGDIGPTIGTVLQDRSAGIYGILGEGPVGMVEVTCAITDADRAVRQALTVSVANTPEQTPRLVATAVIEGFARAMNRVGQGSARWERCIECASGAPACDAGAVSSMTDIGSAASAEVWQTLERLMSEGQSVQRVALVATVQRRIQR